MALLGKIDSFNHNSDDICGYIGRTDQCIFANDIDEAKMEKKKKLIFQNKNKKKKKKKKKKIMQYF